MSEEKNKEIKEIEYVTFTCKNSLLGIRNINYCDSSFIDSDDCNTQNIPPDYKYCKKCLDKGFNNKDTLQEDKRKYKIKDMLINTLPEHLSFKKYEDIVFENIYNMIKREEELKRKFRLSTIIKQALEVAEYYYEEEMEKNNG